MQNPMSTPISPPQITLSESETAIEAIEEGTGSGDSVIRQMIQPDSGVEFRTLRLPDGGESTLVILFSKQEALESLIQFGSEKQKEGALAKLEMMEKHRVVEPIDLVKLHLKASAQKGGKGEENDGVRYRIVDPWEVQVLENREGETKSAALGRERYLSFSLGKVASSSENIFRFLGGLPALELWRQGVDQNSQRLLLHQRSHVYSFVSAAPTRHPRSSRAKEGARRHQACSAFME